VPRTELAPSQRRQAAPHNWATEAILRAHKIKVATLVEMVHAGLITAHSEHMHAGGRVIEITRIRITEAGRRALAEAGP
jgi:hypothetical protein